MHTAIRACRKSQHSGYLEIGCLAISTPVIQCLSSVPLCGQNTPVFKRQSQCLIGEAPSSYLTTSCTTEHNLLNLSACISFMRKFY